MECVRWCTHAIKLKLIFISRFVCCPFLGGCCLFFLSNVKHTFVVFHCLFTLSWIAFDAKRLNNNQRRHLPTLTPEIHNFYVWHFIKNVSRPDDIQTSDLRSNSGSAEIFLRNYLSRPLRRLFPATRTGRKIIREISLTASNSFSFLRFQLF